MQNCPLEIETSIKVLILPYWAIISPKKFQD